MVKLAMIKNKHKVILNWQGEVHEFWTTCVIDKAVNNAISRLAKKVGYSRRMVRDYVMNPDTRRWEVIK